MDLKPWKERATRARNFLFSDIWFMNFQPLPRTKRLLFRALKVAMLLFSNLKADSCYLRASALTFYSIFAVVPLAALLFGIAKGFGLETKLYTTLMEKFSDQQVVIQHIYNFAERTLEHTRGGLIAGIGVVVLLFTILKMIGNIESSFNHIWSVKINRSWFRKFTDYTSLLLVCPIFLISTAGVNTLFRRFTAEGAWLEALAQPMSAFSIRLLPFVMSWLIFTLIYRFMPNTRVQFKAALLSGIISGTVYQLWQMLYIGIQVKLSSYNAIYGSLSALPLFLLWMQYSWVIVLFGTELAFVLQNVDNIEFEPGASRPSIRLRRAVSLIPGIGQGAAAVSQVLLGSSVLIRNTVGIGGVLVLAAVSLLPLLKLLILYLGCQGSAALLQPVSDSRVVEAVGAVAKGFYFLLAAAGSAVVLFALSIAVVCASTNAAYFAG